MIRFRGKAVALAVVVAAVLPLSFALPDHALAVTMTAARSGHSPDASPDASAAAPATASGCNEESIDQWHNCTTVNGGGLMITSISGYGVSAAEGSIPNLHVEIYGPHGLIKNCGTYSLSGMGNTGPICTWKNPSPKTKETAGDYCSISWQYEGGNSYESGGAECIGVHS